jgi:type II secretion system protein G
MRTTPVNRCEQRGFTLVELLVVITIIGILAGLAIPAVIVARNRARIAAAVMDVKQLEMACQAYKEKFGEYPPDFALINDPTQPAAATTAAKQIVLRHLAKAFPRFSGSTWFAFTGSLSAVGIDIYSLTPQTALAFWLGGIPDPNNNYLPSGFGADPTQPFSLPTASASLPLAPVCASRIGPFFDFDPTRLMPVWTPRLIALSNQTGSRNLIYWPQGAAGNQTTGAITYFRAENGSYTVTDANNLPNVKFQQDFRDTNTTPGVVYPAYDTRTSTLTGTPVVVNWVNPRSVQILSAGLDTLFGAVVPHRTGGQNDAGLAFPTGDNYQPSTYDDITNFSGGKLEDSIP